MPIKAQVLDEFSSKAATEMARLWQRQFDEDLDQHDLERLQAAIRLALNHKILFSSSPR